MPNTAEPSGQTPAKIMLLGTFHFQDAGLDAYKPQFDVDVLSERRQREVLEVVERLAVFAPTKIAVERRPERQEELTESFGAYLRGEFDLNWQRNASARVPARRTLKA